MRSEKRQDPINVKSCDSVAMYQEHLRREVYTVDYHDNGNPAEFSAMISRRNFGPATMFQVDVGPVVQTRDASYISQDKCRSVLLVYMAEGGEVQFAQYGRTTLIGPHDCFLMDVGNPYRLVTTDRTRNLTVQIPRNWVLRYCGPEDVSASRIDGSSRWGAVLSAYLRAIYTDFRVAHSLPPTLMVEHILQLVQLTLGAQHLGGSTHQSGILRRIRSAMRDACCEENLSPAAVAAMVGISKSYMHRLFALSGRTFCEELDMMRISLAASLLTSESHRQLKINEIGALCGLSNAAHFTRKFRAIKGVAPSEYRADITTAVSAA